MGCPVFDGMGIFICNISTVAFAFYWPLVTVLCPLLIVNRTFPILLFKASCRTRKKVGIPELRYPSVPIRNPQKFYPTPKEIPRRRPPGIPYLQYRMHGWGSVPGKVSPGEAWRDRPLLKRRVPPRSFLTVEIFSGGSLQGLLQRCEPYWRSPPRSSAKLFPSKDQSLLIAR